MSTPTRLTTGIREYKITYIEKLAKKFVITESGCWEWSGYRQPRGYGQVALPDKTKHRSSTYQAHRVLWELVGNITDPAKQLDHLCRNTSCVNPHHLEQVTSRVNSLRGDTIPAHHVLKTHCYKGHPFSGDNLFIGKTQNGRSYRGCRECKRAVSHVAQIKYRQKRRIKDLEQQLEGLRGK